MKNLILSTDSYKFSHSYMMPENVSFQNSYIESRGGRWNRTLFFGLQMFLKEYLCKRITKADVEEAVYFCEGHGVPFNKENWEYILRKYDGYLPIKISAVAEGSIIPVSNVLVQISNTDPKCAWLTSYLETILLQGVWYPTTVATNSFMCKMHILDALEKSGTPESINFRLHDFGYRGASSQESAGIGGCAHLVNFMGTDTVAGVLYARKYYGAEMAGYSIPASEHSVTCMWGGPEHEADAYKHFINTFGGRYPTFAMVSDSYDIFNAVDNIFGEKLKNDIINSGSTVVIRPDSGNPISIVTSVISHLMDKFGYTINEKGYKVLPEYIRVIQGDGVSEQMIKDILFEMLIQKQSADNISFGMGANLLQNLDRDTFKFACKCSAVFKDNEWQDVFKNPITDPGKMSKKGKLALIKENDSYKTIREEELNGRKNLLIPVFSNGELLIDYNFSDIRRRSMEKF